MEEKRTEPTQTTSIEGGQTPIVIATPTQPQSPKEEEPEDREHLTHFKTWGPVAPRTAPSKSLEHSLRSFSL